MMWRLWRWWGEWRHASRPWDLGYVSGRVVAELRSRGYRWDLP